SSPNDNGNSVNESTTVLRTKTTSSSSSVSNIIYEQPSTSFNYDTNTNVAANPVTESNPQINSSDKNEETSKNEPIPIYIRPSELCFDDVDDSGEILNEFFMPSSSTSSYEPAKPTTTSGTTLTVSGMSAGSNTMPIVTFAQLWNFNEQFDHKEAHPLSSQATSTTICPL
ncbi:unnamed protein product, partial [Onchocerca flexuosa]|uniref:BESS domain-containing protein n=1 Tax=Onchocerca flexuosa TaxID=387005 RepID=A0A183H6N5_9BILA